MSTLTPEQRFAELMPPPAPTPIGVYKPLLVVGKFLYLSGHGPLNNDKTFLRGKVGVDMDLEQGKLAAQQVGLTMIASIKKHLGSLDKIKRVVKVLGWVNCVQGFEKHPYVINGCSELFAKIWGEENGIGVRSAIGSDTLPDNIPVEIEAMFELH